MISGGGLPIMELFLRLSSVGAGDGLPASILSLNRLLIEIIISNILKVYFSIFSNTIFSL